MKKKKKATEMPVLSCRLNKEQKEFLLKFDRTALIAGRKPSISRALEQIALELGFRSSGYDEDVLQSKLPQAKKEG